MRAAVAVFAKPSKRHHAEGEATWRTPAASMTFTVLKSAVDQWFRHRSGRLGAALAFYSIFFDGTVAAHRDQRCRFALRCRGRARKPLG
jgi:hypothetical protein